MASPLRRVLRRRFLAVLLFGSLAAWLLLWWLERSDDQQAANYSLIEEGLYMGGYVEAPPPGTRAVLNLCEKEDPYRTEMYLWEAIPDTAPGPDLDWLRRQTAWLAARRQAGQTTFVHCRNGVSRSALVVTAYLMSKNHWTRDQALQLVRTKRPEARPNPAFLERLGEWERALQEPPALR
jgi:hypothetical protein